MGELPPLIFYNRLPVCLQLEICLHDRASLRRVPSILPRKVPFCYDCLPVAQLLEDIIMYVQDWSQTEKQLSSRLKISELKRKLRVLEQEHYLHASSVY